MAQTVTFVSNKLYQGTVINDINNQIKEFYWELNKIKFENELTDLSMRINDDGLGDISFKLEGNIITTLNSLIRDYTISA